MVFHLSLPFISLSHGEVPVPRALSGASWLCWAVALLLFTWSSLTVDDHASPWLLASGSPHSASPWFWYQAFLGWTSWLSATSEPLFGCHENSIILSCASQAMSHIVGFPLVHSTPFSAWVSSHAGPKMRCSFIYLECDYRCCQRSKKNGSIDIEMFPCFLKQFTRNSLIIHLPIKEYLWSAYYFPSTILGEEI